MAKRISSFTLRTLAGALACIGMSLAAIPTHAQYGAPTTRISTAGTQNAEPVIIAPAQPATNYSLDENDTDTSYVTKLNGLFGQTISNLQSNLLALHELGNASNQRTMNEFGKSYGNIDKLGDRLNEAISGMDLSLIRQDTDALSANVSGSVSSYGEISAHFSENLANTINTLSQGMDLKSLGPNPDSNAIESSPAVGDLRKKLDSTMASKMAGMKSVTGQFRQLIALNDSISLLNSNLESVVKTYNQMLSLNSRSPSELASMTGLAAKIGKFNSLAGSQLKIIDSLHRELAVVNAKYDALNKAGGVDAINKPETYDQASEALAQTGASIAALTSHIEGANKQMAMFLGTPAVQAQAGGTETIPIPPMPKAMREVVQGAQIAPPEHAGDIPQIDPSQIPAPPDLAPPPPPPLSPPR